MNDEAREFKRHTVATPDPRFAFRVEAPADWAQVTVPEEPDPAPADASFQPVAMFSARYGAIVFVFAVRPAFEDGTVAEWLGRLSVAGGIELTEAAPIEVAGVEAVGAAGVQPSDLGPITLRLALFEQGGWAHSLTAMAPAEVWRAVSATFDRMFATFALASPQPTTVPAWPRDESWEEGPADADTAEAKDPPRGE